MRKLIRTYIVDKHVTSLTKKSLDKQQKILHSISKILPHTKYGKHFTLHTHTSTYIQNHRKNLLPIVDYETYKPWIEESKQSPDIIRKGQIPYYAISSGTTSAQKYIPVSKQVIRDTAKAGLSLTMMMLKYFPKRKILSSLRRPLGWSIQHIDDKGIQSGDISALMMINVRKIFHGKYLFPLQKLIASDRKDKLTVFINTLHSRLNKNIIMFGVSSRIYEVLDTIQSHDTKTFQRLSSRIQAIVWGWVSIKPFVQQLHKRGFHDIIGVYNASEWYIGIQDIGYKNQNDPNNPYILLCNHWIYYECIPFTKENFDNEGNLVQEKAQAISLQEITSDHIDQKTKFALVMSTRWGLYRYMIGDIIRFVDMDYRYVIEWRTKQSLNLKGEELMIDHTDSVIRQINNMFSDIHILHYTVWPDLDQNPTKHIRIVEAQHMPDATNINKIQNKIDELLQISNADYKAKRTHDMLLKKADIHVVCWKTYATRLQKHKKLWWQNKVPKLTHTSKLRKELIDISKTIQTK